MPLRPRYDDSRYDRVFSTTKRIITHGSILESVIHCRSDKGRDKGYFCNNGFAGKGFHSRKGDLFDPPLDETCSIISGRARETRRMWNERKEREKERQA